MNRKLGITYDPKTELIVTVGGSEAIDISIRALINPGDEVLIVEPSFVCYAPIVRLAGGVPVPMATRLEDSFKLTPEILRSHITPRTKLLVLPFPNNPTGAIMTREELEKIAEVLRGTNILVLSDEIYSELTYGRTHCSIAQIEGMQERTILVNGFSQVELYHEGEYRRISQELSEKFDAAVMALNKSFEERHEQIETEIFNRIVGE